MLVKGPLVAVFDPDVGATVKMHACALECVREESALLASFLQSMSQQGNDAPTLPGTYSHWQDLFSHIVLSSDPGRLAAVVQTPDLPQDSLLALFQLARVWQMPQLLALYRSELTARLSIDTVVGCFARALAAAPTPILLPGGAGVAQDGVTMAVGPHTVSAVEGSEDGVPASRSGQSSPGCVGGDRRSRVPRSAAAVLSAPRLTKTHKEQRTKTAGDSRVIPSTP